MSDQDDRIRELEHENRRLVAMLDALPDHLFLLSPDARMVFHNRSTREFMRSGEQSHKAMLEGSGESSQHLREVVARVCCGETIIEEYLLPHRLGARWRENHIAPVCDPRGGVEAVAVASRDIHDRKRAEARLQLLSKVGVLAGATDLEDVLVRASGLAVPELADWSVFAFVEDGFIQRPRIVHPDPRRAALASDLLGDTPRPLEDIQLQIFDVATLDDSEADDAFFTLLKRLEATTAIVLPFVVMGAPVAIAAFVYGTESGRRHHEADLPVAEELGRRVGQIVENARLHAELARSLEYRERVLGVLGHDLRNPLSAVLGIAKLLGQRGDVSDRTKEGLHHIQSSAERMEQMISTILDFTRLRFRGMPELAREPFDLGTLARALVDELRVAHASRDIALATDGDLCGRWDQTRIGQVISNLIANALTHGYADTPVEVHAAAETHHVCLAVTNRGPTIPADAIGKLFDPFWQAQSEKPRGLGLGLYIAQEVVAAHGGTISVSSEDDHTVFTIRLPR